MAGSVAVPRRHARLNVCRRAGLRLLAFLCLAVAASVATAQVSVTDDTGAVVSLPRPAQRIVSLAPHITELLFLAGAGARLVGVDSGSDYPPQARGIARVGGAAALDLEAIVALRPDLVVAWASGSPAGQVQRVAALGIAVFRSEPRRLEDIPRDLERLGALAGSSPTAARAADRWRAQAAALHARYRDRPTLRVFYQVWHRPLMTVGGTHIISQLLRICGGRNIFEELQVLAPAVSVEAVLQRDPEVILVGGEQATAGEALAQWRRWPEMVAVRRQRLLWLPADLIERPGPRLLDGTARLCQALDAAREAAH